MVTPLLHRLIVGAAQDVDQIVRTEPFSGSNGSGQDLLGNLSGIEFLSRK